MDLFNYVMHTPQNTNPAVLNSEISKTLKENNSLGITNAKKGQTIRISEINNGVPTSWEAIDMGKSTSGTETIVYDMSTVTWEPGTLNQSGVNLSNNYRVRTTGAIQLPKGARITTNELLNMDVATYTSWNSPTSYNFINKRGFSKDDFVTTTEGFYRIVLYDDANTKYGGDNETIAASTEKVVITYQKEGATTTDEKSFFKIVMPYKGFVLAETTESESTAPAANNLSALYTAWDALVTDYPNNVSMEVLGTDSNGLEMRCYSITSNSDSFKWTLANPPKNYKILWISGVHGHESTIFVDDLKFFKTLLAQGDEITSQLFNYCDFKIIPAACPYGYEHGTRTNANGVNINRNFPANWVLSGEGTNNYSGASALSEFESQTISKFLNDNSNCLLAINRHSSSEFSPTSVLGYFVSQFTNDQIVAYNMCRFMSAQMKRSNLYTYITSAENSDAAKRCLYTVEASTATGTLDKYFNSLGIHGYLYEASPINKITATGTAGYDSDWGRLIWQRINVSNIGNLLYSVLLLNEYIK